jgi:hypothetical protein
MVSALNRHSGNDDAQECRDHQQDAYCPIISVLLVSVVSLNVEEISSAVS